MSKTRKALQYVLAAAIIAALAYFASLHLSQQRPLTKEDKLLHAELQKNEDTTLTIKQGSFNPNAQDSDDLHRGSGKVAIIYFMGEHRLVMMEDFKVTNGPDYKIYLLNHSNVQTEQRFKQIKEQSHQLAPLKQFSGFQVFTLPQNTNPQQIQSVLIWCEAFSQFITNADLH